MLVTAALLLALPASAVAAAPTVLTEKASAVTKTTATLNATVNPNGEEVTDCKFEYGTTIEYKSAPVSCSSLPGAGTSAVPVSAPVTGLAPNTEYHFRISATNKSGPMKGVDETFKTLPNAPAVVTKAASSVAKTSATLNATVNPEGGTVTDCKFEYGTTMLYGSSMPCSALPTGTSPVPVSAAVAGLLANTTYHFRISATNAGGTSLPGLDETLKTLPNAPAVVTAVASEITQTTAKLNGTVNPEGGEVSDCKFEYGTTNTYVSSLPCTPKPGSGTSPEAVSALPTLTPNTEYHFRVVATNPGGTGNGSDLTFKTPPKPPTVTTEKASSITQTTATLNATVNPEGGTVTDCKFEYGTTMLYGLSASCTPGKLGSGTSPLPVSATLSGATASTTYHFRISATNAGGTSKGPDLAFTTPAAGSGEAPLVVGPGGGGPLHLVPPRPTGLPAPLLARVGNISYVTGRVSVRLPGTRKFVPLWGSRQIPYRSVIDATHGEVSVTTAARNGGTQTGEFFDGQFMLTQGRNGRVLATLTGGDFAPCKRPRASSRRAAGTHLARRLWAMVTGSFSTRGTYAAGAVGGAQWLTEDMCRGTLILATRERVEVTDLVRHRRVLVRAGQIYIAKAR